MSFFKKNPMNLKKNEHSVLEMVYLTLITGKDVAFESIEFGLPSMENAKETAWDEYVEMHNDTALTHEQKCQYLKVRLDKCDRVILLYHDFIELPKCQDSSKGMKATLEKSEEILENLMFEGEKIDTQAMLKIWKSKFPARIVEALGIKRENNDDVSFALIRREMKEASEIIAEAEKLESDKLFESKCKIVQFDDAYIIAR